ncbi:hypothetical protein OAT93_01035 [bacterium]|nr:hypothetical protein [bacterium]
MISVTIDAPIFDLSVYYNAKLDSLEFLGNGEHRYIVWSIIDHKIPDVWRTSGILKFKTILPIPYGYVNRTPETPINARNDRL